MVWQKGFEFLIKAMPEILSAIPAAKLLLVGEGPLKKGLENLAVSLKVKKSVIFAGYRSDITEILAAIDLLVVPSLLEGFPMITLEAMSAAKPVIATCRDGITEQIIDGKNGIMVPPEDHNALAKVILRLSQDRDLSKKLGMAARERVVREFTVDKMVAETEKVYSELLMGSHG
jgi:glycosyltransferase involved in cell wall biosynthesis